MLRSALVILTLATVVACSQPYRDITLTPDETGGQDSGTVDSGEANDGGTPDDGGSISDGGAVADGGTVVDGGSHDAGPVDAGPTCSSDSTCGSGTRCCSEDHHCHPKVGANEDCDCAHPCPEDQGCFPGTCGATPQKCRPGCFPGSAPDASHPTGVAPAACAQQDGKPAYCTALPPSQVTTQNQGGACAGSDGCDVAAQNCPDLPLDRTQPQGPNNPPVRQTCRPIAPGANICMPAGSIPAWGINCDQQCGTTANSCVQGYECVTPIGSSGQAIGPSECRKQCSHPGTDPSSDCPTARSSCQTVLVTGMAALSTGVCEEPPCFSNADCRGFAATPCCNTNNICDVCN
jgi:hypothetical protein